MSFIGAAVGVGLVESRNMDVRMRNSAILSAVERGDLDQFIKIINGDDALLHAFTPLGTWLHIAAYEGQLKMVEYLLQQGLDINADGGTLGGGALNAAASKGHAATAEFLLSKGAKLDVSEPEKNPLFGAIYAESKQTVLLLLDSGIDFSIKYSGESMKNMDAIAFAKERGQSEIAEIIQQRAHKNQN
ncbi:MAG: ankyrin repeat domain-containing protein [Hyphomicrobiales bacterium]|nr:MAG: ankyrin repeat domain-containing protein [Hyphomicrobiales bacterium]